MSEGRLDPIEFDFPPQPRFLRSLRNQLRHALGERGVAEDTTDVVLLVVDEIVSNAIEHATDYRSGAANLSLRVAAAPERVSVEFVDPEVPDELVAELQQRVADSRNGPPPLDSERGRGLFLITEHFGEVRIDRAADGGLHLRGDLA
ncbi:MAG: ATP-binding protein [Planctomycetota bacterium]